jgi:DNA polymerase (family 10)
MAPAISSALREIAIYLGLEGERFRAKAYLRAAQSLEAAKGLERLITEGRLSELPGVGASIAGLVEELAATGTAPLLDRLRERWPAMLVELARLPGVGAPKARKLLDALSPRDLDELADMCEAGAVRELPGFGKSSEAKLRDAIRGRHATDRQMLLEHARGQAEAVASYLRASPAVVDAVVCGAIRRWVEIVETIQIAVAVTDGAAARARLAEHPMVKTGALKVDLYLAPPEGFGTAQVLATGSDAHLEKLRARAGRALETIAAADEVAFYRALDLPWIPPEVRDGTDELDDDFSDLVTLEDITGAVHCHTVASDGRNTVAQMATAAEQRGLHFITITDHSQTAGYAGGLSVERLLAQAGEIAEVQAKTKVRLLRGTESDILKDGSLDYPDDVLRTLDVVIASVHQRYKLDQDGMTRRLVAAMRQPVFKIWGHALGRMLMRRPPVDVRFDEILDAIADSPCAIEINGDPHRLDLDPARARAARARGAKFVLSTDAHSTAQLDYIANAVGMARRARIRRGDVLNTLPPDEFARAVAPSR